MQAGESPLAAWPLRPCSVVFLDFDGVLPGRVLGKTPALNRERGLEIDAWLASVPYPVKSFVILDDREDMAMHRERLVRIEPTIGLTAEQARLAIEVLVKPWKV